MSFPSTFQTRSPRQISLVYLHGKSTGIYVIIICRPKLFKKTSKICVSLMHIPRYNNSNSSTLDPQLYILVQFSLQRHRFSSNNSNSISLHSLISCALLLLHRLSSNNANSNGSCISWHSFSCTDTDTAAIVILSKVVYAGTVSPEQTQTQQQQQQ